MHRLSLAVSGNGAASEANGAIGTKNARKESWKVLVQYIARDPAAWSVASALAPTSYMILVPMHCCSSMLVSQEDVRSPHNYLLNTWARLGLVGLLLTFGIILCGLRLARLVARNASRIRDDDVLAVLLVASIPVAAVVGVVLESPFGALPYFWALGHLSARACQTGAVVPFGRRASVRRTSRPDMWPAHRESTRARTAS